MNPDRPLCQTSPPPISWKGWCGSDEQFWMNTAIRPFHLSAMPENTEIFPGLTTYHAVFQLSLIPHRNRDVTLIYTGKP